MELFKDPKKLIAIFVALAVVALAIGFGVMWFQTQKDPDGLYNFKGEAADHFETDEGILVPAPLDKQFYIVQITLKNDKYGPGLNTIELVWKVTIDRMTYSMDLYQTKLHKDFMDMTFEKGKLWGYTVVFVIPETVAFVDISMSYTYVSTEKTPSLEYDSDLKLPDPKLSTSETIALASRP